MFLRVLDTPSLLRVMIKLISACRVIINLLRKLFSEESGSGRYIFFFHRNSWVVIASADIATTEHFSRAKILGVGCYNVTLLTGNVDQSDDKFYTTAAIYILTSIFFGGCRFALLNRCTCW